MLADRRAKSPLPLERDQEHHYAGDEEGGGQVEQRDQDIVRPGRQARRAAAHHRDVALLAPRRLAHGACLVMRLLPRPCRPSAGRSRARPPPGRRSPMMRPSHMTRMRSESERTSSSSTETSRIALPASRMARSWRWMNSIAPMSTPRVGWPTRSTDGSRSISRASTIFCWLPPEKFAVFSRQFGGRMSYCSIFFRASSRMAPNIEERAVQEARVAVIAERGVLPFLEGHHEAHAVAVLRHMREAALAQRRGIGVRHHRQRLAVRG